TGDENSNVYAAYVAKIFSATEEFQDDVVIDGVKIVILEEDNEKSYSIISRVNCSTKDYLALFIGNPGVNLGMARLINKRGLERLKQAFLSYQN
ncbi:MAG: hypothetical protein ACTSSH_11085, partial [Candidatus Heimdallarchaeota archaeon]